MWLKPMAISFDPLGAIGSVFLSNQSVNQLISLFACWGLKFA
jgi:hypothetical protein